MQAETKSTAPQELLQLRDSIDSIDEEILSALARRFEITNKVGQLKAAHGLESVDPVREQEKLQQLRQSAEQKGLNTRFVHELFQQLFNEVVKNHRDFLQKRDSSH
jgi:chorismate mutase